MQKYLYKIAIPVLLLLLPVAVNAADPAPASEGHTMNVALVSLVSLIVVLLLAIGLLGNVLRLLASVYSEKMRAKKQQAGNTRILLTFLLLMFPLSLVHAEEAITETTPAMPGVIAGMAAFDFYLLIGIITLEVVVILAMLATMAVMVRLLSATPEMAAKVKAIAPKPFWDRFNKAVAIEKEQDILLDHDYDGIRELDNSLPPWWKYGFYLTIVIAVVYIYYYHIGGNGPDQLQEFAMEMERGEEEKAKYLAQSANNVDENNVTLADAAGIASGQVLFQNMCAACHAKDGGGGVGPNLTDAYWLHGGSLQEVFKSVKYGWPDKGMKSWKEDFSPRQIAEIASYVTSLQGTTPAAPKEKQGELYAANATGAAVNIDSAGAIADTTSAK